MLGALLTLSAAVRAVRAVQDEVLIAGFGRRGHAVGDIPGVRFKVRWQGQGGGVPERAACRVLALGAPVQGASKGVRGSAARRRSSAWGRGGTAVWAVQSPAGRFRSGARVVLHPTLERHSTWLHLASRRAVLCCAVQVVKVSGVSLLALFRGKKEKPRCALVYITWI